MEPLKMLPENSPKTASPHLGLHIAVSSVFLCPSPTPIELPLKCFREN